MTSTPTKRGRPRRPYITSQGEHVNGLRRRSNGRWVIVATGESFREPDERLALLRFRQSEAKRKGNLAMVPLPLSLAPNSDDAAAIDAVLRHEQGDGEHAAAADESLILRIAQNEPLTLIRAMPETALWAYVRQQLIDRPAYVAQQVGIEQISYLSDIPKPVPSPTLTEVGELFFAKKISENWLAKCRIFWREFQDQVEVQTIRELSQEHLLAYEEMVIEAMRDGGHESTYARQRYQAIKSIIRFPPKRGKWAIDCQRVEAFCKVLIPPPKSATDPRPIDRTHFHALLNVANDQMQAMLLLMLNACMYGGEVAALDWNEINLDKATLSTHRQKTGVVRIAVLWPRTIESLKRLPHKSEAIFHSATGMRHNYQTVYKSFKALRKSAGLSANVQLSHVRDGAYTAAVEAGIDLYRCKLLAGHETGMSDPYVRRAPKMVGDACDAIQRAYFGPS